MTDRRPTDLAAAGQYVRALQLEADAITAATIAARTPRQPAIRPARPAPTATPADRPDHDWRVYANCRGIDPNLFYPQKSSAAQAAEAKAVCAGCVVRATCLAHALEHHETHGVWGGTTEKERRRLWRQLPRWARCHRCGRRYLKDRPGQKYCTDTSCHTRAAA